eukprot:1871681-Alexandrium_andersonii.AAC.1
MVAERRLAQSRRSVLIPYSPTDDVRPGESSRPGAAAAAQAVALGPSSQYPDAFGDHHGRRD